MNKLEFLKLIANAPKSLRGYTELLNYARNAYKQIMGVFPEGIDNITIKQAAKEASDNRRKIVQFPGGGKDKTDFFTTRPDPRVKQPPGAKMDIQRANENLAGGANYAEGDTKYNADILGTELARVRGFIDEGQDATDMDPKEYSKLYDEAYSYLTQLRRLNRKPPGEGELSVTIEGQTKNMTPEGIMDFIMSSGLKGTSTNIGKAPKTKKTKPKVDPELQKAEDQKQMFLDFEDRNKTSTLEDATESFFGFKPKKKTETEAEMLERMNRQNKEAVERLKKKKEKDLGDKLKDLPDDIDPDAMAMGGRIGMSKGGGLIDLLKFFSKKSPFQAYKDYLASVKRRAQTEPEKLAPELGAVTAGGIFTNRRMKDILEEGNELQKEKFLQEYIEELNKDPFYIDRPELKDKAIEQYTETIFVEKKAYGGRIGFEDGGMARRAFLKLMGGLASIPVFGKLFKGAKPAAKVAKTVDVAKTSGVPAYFPKLVEKIKLLGDDITETAATQERQVVTKYKDYEMTENLSTGSIEIEKTNEGVGTFVNMEGGVDTYDGIVSK